MFENMEDQYQQTSGEGDESVHRKGVDDSGDLTVLDGYSGPRSRMVYGKQSYDLFGTNTSRKHDFKLGILERITLAGLAGLIVFAILVSLAILPFAMAGFFFYKALSIAYAFFNKLLTGKRPTIK